MPEPAPTAEAPPETAFRRLRTAGRWLRRTFGLLAALNVAVLVVLVVAVAVAEGGQHLLKIHVVDGQVCGTPIFGAYKCIRPKGGVTSDLVSFTNALQCWRAAWYAGVLIVRNLPPLMILLQLKALCTLYEEGVVFARANVRHVRWIGVWAMAWAATPTLIHFALAPAGADLHGYFKNGSDPIQIILALVGATALLAAQVMQVGRHIEDERSQFV